MAQLPPPAEPSLARLKFRHQQTMNPRLSEFFGADYRWRLASHCLTSYSGAADPAPTVTISAKDLAANLSSLQDGASYVRLRLEVKQPADTTKISLQFQIKERRTRTATDLVYQVLWPKERKGEAVLLHKADGSPPAGSLFIPPDKPQPFECLANERGLF